MPFSHLGLTPASCSVLARLGYQQPTPIQSAAIPVVLGGHDVMARAQTGTGKTAAFGLPMVQRLTSSTGRTRSRTPRGLVLVPTRELAGQVHQSLAAYGATSRLSVTPIFGGVAIGPQLRVLQQGTDILVATPGRLIDCLERRALTLSGIEILTLDEADRMLDMGFLPALRRIVQLLPQKRQTLLFSATFTAPIIELAAQFTRQAVSVDVSDGAIVAPTVTHHVHAVPMEGKRDLLMHVLAEAPTSQALVFCRTKRESDRVGRSLEESGVKVAVIHGNKSQNARTRALRDFQTGRVGVLVATDIAARGLDIAQLPLVVNYALPLVAEDYVHRVGRTGRAGHTGRAVSLVSPAERPLLRDIQRLLPEPLEQITIDAFIPRQRAEAPASPRRPSTAPGRGRPRARRFPSAGAGRYRHSRP
jgi:ATP-dependent RNA helicase RhlE